MIVNRRSLPLFAAFLAGVLFVATDGPAFTLRVAPNPSPCSRVVEPSDHSEFALEGNGRVRSWDSSSPLQGSEETGMGGAVSVRRAVFYSFLLPGLGDYYIGRRGRAKAFFIAEAAIWTSFIAFETQGWLREGGYKDFSMTFAGISRDDHSDDYYRLLAEFNTSREYEEAIKREGRYFLYPNDNHDALEDYFLAHKVSDFEPWEWRDVDKRLEYRKIRKGSRQAYRRAVYSLATALANRFVSCLFTLKSARDFNRRGISRSGGFHIEFGYPRFNAGDPFQTGLMLVRRF
jgi:hypothetical protein